MVFLLQQVSLDKLADVLSHAQLVPVLLVAVTVSLSLLTRTARWQVYFLPDRHVPFAPLFGTLSISYMASTFLPFRAGELVRAVFLGQRQAIAVPRVIGTILIEKLFDFVGIGVLLLLLVMTTPLPSLAVAAGQLITAVILFGFGFVMALAVWRRPTLALIGAVEHRVPFGLGRRLRLEYAARQFAEGTDALRVPRLWVPMLGWTAVTWVLGVLTGWAGGAALNVQPGLAAVVFLAVATASGQSLPSSPGYVGVYHLAAAGALVAFGVDWTTAFGVALVTHAFSYGPLVIIGLIALWSGGYSFGQLSVVSGQWSVGTTSTPSETPEASAPHLLTTDH